MRSRSKSFIKKKDLKQSQSECIDAFNRKLTKKYVGILTHSVKNCGNFLLLFRKNYVKSSVL